MLVHIFPCNVQLFMLTDIFIGYDSLTVHRFLLFLSIIKINKQ